MIFGSGPFACGAANFGCKPPRWKAGPEGTQQAGLPAPQAIISPTGKLTHYLIFIKRGAMRERFCTFFALEPQQAHDAVMVAASQRQTRFSK